MAGVAEAFVTVRPDMDKFSGDLKSGLGSLAKVAAGAALGITAAIGGAAVAGVRKFAQLERGMNEVFTLMPGISEEAMGEMTQDVRDFAVEMGVATDEVVPALYQALSAGVPRENVFEFMEVATKASIGGITELETAVDGITSVTNAYGDQIEDAAEASDLMFTAVRLGKTDFEQLSSSLSNVIPIAAANKVEFADIAAALATMTAQGVPTAQATTQLRQAIVELSDSGSAVGEAFEDVANVSFRDFMASGGDMGDVMGVLEEAAANSGLSVDQLFGSVEAGSAALALSGENLETFEGNLGEMADAAGATDEAFETMDSGLSRTWDRIQVVFGDLLLELGERIAPALQRFADWFEENLPAIIEWFEEVGEKAGELGTAIVEWWEEDAQPALTAFIAAVEESWPKIQEVLGQIGELFGTLGETIDKVMGDASDDVEDTEQDWSESMGSMLDAVNEFLTGLNWVVSQVGLFLDLMSGMFSGNTERIIETLDQVTGGAYSALVVNMGRILADFRVTVEETIDSVVQWFRDLPGRIVAALGNLGGTLTGAGRDIIGGLLSGIREQWEETASFLGSLGGRIRELKGPIEKDRVLLTDIGEEIIGGLGRGMEREWTNIERQLGIMTAELPTNITASSMVAGESGTSVTIPVMLTGVDGIAREVGRSDAFIDSYGRVSAKRARLTAGS